MLRLLTRNHFRRLAIYYNNLTASDGDYNATAFVKVNLCFDN